MSFQNPFEGKFHLGQKVIIVKKYSSLYNMKGIITNISRIICSGIPKVNPNFYLNGSYQNGSYQNVCIILATRQCKKTNCGSISFSSQLISFRRPAFVVRLLGDNYVSILLLWPFIKAFCPFGGRHFCQSDALSVKVG